MCVNKFLRVDSEGEHGLEFDKTGTVKSGLKRSEGLEDHRVAVALNSIKRLHAGQGLAPREMLAVDIADIKEEEGLTVD